MNIITITGNLGRDSDLRRTANGKSVLNFSVANSCGHGEHKKTYWFKCNLWGDRADKLHKHLTKGAKLLITGEMQLREWEKDGEKKLSPEIFVKEIEFIGGKKEDSQTSTGNSDVDDTFGAAGFVSDDDDQVPF